MKKVLSTLRPLLNLLDLEWEEEEIRDALAPYRLQRQLSAGQLSLVFSASSSGTRKPDFVIKFPSVGPHGPVASVLFDNIEILCHEARVLDECSGIPNVVALVEDRTEAKLPFFVIEHLDDTLKKEIERQKQLPIPECLEVLRDVAVALEGMHDMGICHHDVKPENIVRGPQGWTLIDPAPQDVHTQAFKDEDIRGGEERDIFALGATCRVASVGYNSSMLNPQLFRQLREVDSDLAELFRRLLKDGRCKVPKARTVRKKACRLLQSFASV